MSPQEDQEDLGGGSQLITTSGSQHPGARLWLFSEKVLQLLREGGAGREAEGLFAFICISFAYSSFDVQRH